MAAAENYKNFLRDIIYAMKERIDKERTDEKTNPLSEFESGQIFEVECLVNTIENQAEYFDIDINEIGFYDYEEYKKKTTK